MRRLSFIFSIFASLPLFTLLLLTTVPAYSEQPSASAAPAAQEAMGASATEGQKQSATPATTHYEKPTTSISTSPKPDTKPQIITDEKTGTVRVLIGGREVLTIDAQGLHVRGDIEYGGLSTDYGESGFEETLKREREQGHAR